MGDGENQLNNGLRNGLGNADLIKALRVSEASYRGLVETANSIILRMDHQGIITFINRYGIEFFGFTENELLGQSVFSTILSGKFLGDSPGDQFDAILKNPNAYSSHSNENFKKDGTRVWISWTNKGILDGDDNLFEILCVGNDITPLKSMEKELSHHRQNLESLVQERTRDLALATAELANSQNRLMLLSAISTCIIQGKSTEFTINEILEQLTHMFKDCRAAYARLISGAKTLGIEFTRGPDFVPDLLGCKLSVNQVGSYFSDTHHPFIPHAVSDICLAPKINRIFEFAQGTDIRSYLMTPLHESNRIMGFIFVYSMEPRPWKPSEIQLMKQIGESLSVAIGQQKHKIRLIEQEQFLENIFSGVDIAVFVLGVENSGRIVFENINQQYEKLRQILREQVAGKPFGSLSSHMSKADLNRIIAKVSLCIQERKTITFMEQTDQADEKKYWLTRLTPVCDKENRVFRIIGASTDISDQILAEKAMKKNETRLRDAQRTAKLGDCERDVSTMMLSCSEQLYQIFGWDENTCPSYQDFLDVLHPDDLSYVQSTIENALESKKSYDLEYRVIRGGSEERIVKEIGEMVLDSSGMPVKISGIVQDITELKQFKDEIELARKVFDNAVEGVVVTDLEGTIQFVNKGFCQITGYSEEEALGQNPRLLKSDRHDHLFYEKMWMDLGKNGGWAGEIWNRRKNGEAYPEWLSITAIDNHLGEPVRYMSVFHDLSDIRQREEQLHFQANYDALTGLPNRTLLRDRINMCISKLRREQTGLALIFLDLDDFKHVNDTLGHVNGDLLLQKFSKRLLESVREQDTVARYGGDEFIILIPDTKETNIVIQIIERIRKSLLKVFTIAGKEFIVGASIGVTICPDDGADTETLIANADMAMYRSKEMGKGQFGFFTQELNQQIAQRFDLKNDLRLALRRNEFVLYYQPKLDLKTNRICGAEALIRWAHPERGLVSPFDFIPLAEETGLIVPMGEWILNQACVKAGKWSAKLGYTFPIAVNVSAIQVRDVDMLAQIENLLEIHGILPGNLELEITESAVMANVEKAKKMFKEIHAMGINISIDDFGTGFSSLSYLRLFPVAVLKIDKSFIDDIPMNQDSNTMVTTIMSMARHLKLMTVAEGVEKKEQLDFLIANNCNQIQGYYFSPPLAEDRFYELLKKHNCN